MIVPTSNKKIEIGDIIILIEKINGPYFIIYPGHEFEVIDKNDYGFILKDPDSGITISHIQTNQIVYKISIEDAAIEYKERTEINECINFIKENCSNKSHGYDHYDKYDSCKLLKCFNNYCSPKIECSKYISSEDIKKCKVLKKRLRSFKLKKIEKS